MKYRGAVLTVAILVIMTAMTSSVLAEDHRTLSITNTGGGALQVYNLPGAASENPTYSQTAIDAAELAGNLANWTTTDIDSMVSKLIEVQIEGCYTAFFRANGEFAKCDDDCRDCEVVNVVGTSTGVAAVTLSN